MAITGVGMSTFDFAESLPALPGALETFDTLGATSVEVMLGAYDVVVGATMRRDRLAELKRILADSPLDVTVHGPIASRFTDRATVDLQVDVCRACLEASGEIGARLMVHHAGWTPRGDVAARADALALERDALARVAVDAKAAGVVLAVENIPGDATRQQLSPAELAEQIKAVDHPSVRATIDFSHAALNAAVEGFDLMTSLEALAPVAAHLHIHDSFGRTRVLEPFGYGDATLFGIGDLHLPPGWGVLDWEAIARLPYTQDVIANLELSRRYMEALPASIALCNKMSDLSKG